jgi:hypothetical protein
MESYPPLGTLGTTFTGPRLGEPVSVLLDIVTGRSSEMSQEAEKHLVLLTRRHGSLARTNIGLTGRPITSWDIERLLNAAVL